MSSPASAPVAVLGCGAVGSALARRLLADAPGRRVVGTTTSEQRVAELEGLGVEPRVLRLVDVERVRAAIDGCPTVVCTVAAGRRDGSYREVYLDGMRALIDALEGGAARHVIYTSSSAVYGQDDGGWVDEDSPTEPAGEAGRVLVETERVLRDGVRALGGTATILRLCGLWSATRGPQRFIERLAGSERGDGDAYLNLVHEDDVVEALARLVAHPYDGVLCLNDDRPTTRREYYDRLVAAAGLPAVRWRDDGSRGKRVRNARIKSALDLELVHPEH